MSDITPPNQGQETHAPEEASGSDSDLIAMLSSDNVKDFLVYEIAKEASDTFWKRVNSRVTTVTSVLAIVGIGSSGYLALFGLQGVDNQVDQRLQAELPTAINEAIDDRSHQLNEVVSQMITTSSKSFVEAVNSSEQAAEKAKQALADSQDAQSEATEALQLSKQTLASTQKTQAEIEAGIASQSLKLKEASDRIEQLATPGTMDAAKALLDAISDSDPTKNESAAGLLRVHNERTMEMAPPVGTVIAWMGKIQPWPELLIEPVPGWLLCNGAEIEVGERGSQTARFQALAEILRDGPVELGNYSFSLPDLTDEFLRGASINRRAGHEETDSIGMHSHTMHGQGAIEGPVGGFLGRANDAFSGVGGARFGTGGGVGAGLSHRMRTGDDAWKAGTQETAQETRPQNVAVWFLIKY